MTTATCLGRDPLFLSSSSSSSCDRAAALKIRFADIIVKLSSNKSEALMRITREKECLEKKRLEEEKEFFEKRKLEEEKEFLEKKQLEEKAMIEERMKVRQEARLAVIKMEEEEEEASPDFKYEHSLSTEKELLILCGGSRRARDRSFFNRFGLVSRPGSNLLVAQCKKTFLVIYLYSIRNF